MSQCNELMATNHPIELALEGVHCLVEILQLAVFKIRVIT